MSIISRGQLGFQFVTSVVVLIHLECPSPVFLDPEDKISIRGPMDDPRARHDKSRPTSPQTDVDLVTDDEA